MSTETLEDFITRAKTEFLLRNNESLIRKEIVGELEETNIFDISYWHGNGELIASNDEHTVTFGFDKYGDNYIMAVIE